MMKLYYTTMNEAFMKFFKLIAIALIGVILCAIGYYFTQHILFMVGVFWFAWGLPIVAITHELCKNEDKE